jgi:hypothetical protein
MLGLTASCDAMLCGNSAKKPELSQAPRSGHADSTNATMTPCRPGMALADAAYPAVSLSVSCDNPALRLYQRLGFVAVARNADAVTMRRKIRN